MNTAVESKQQYIATMGEPLGMQYAELWQEIAQLHITWLELVELYGTKESRITLLNRCRGELPHRARRPLGSGRKCTSRGSLTRQIHSGVVTGRT
jgi:hypothetical protein